ncbi:hypothetical protein [Kitasatospora sp. NPDC001547]|uniref:hypothetical protein n=1 Tax=Kitasatospora sp. NPDC001547 TaxID=3364015 RepID=UPI0036A091C4
MLELPPSASCAPAPYGRSTSASAPPPRRSPTTTSTTRRPPRLAPAPPVRPPLADHTAYQELRRQLREQALARQATLDEAAAEREAILARHYNRLREPEAAHQHTIEEAACASATTADEHDRQQRERHRAALAVARATRTGTIPLRLSRSAPPRTGRREIRLALG